MSETEPKTLDEWLATRPASVQALATEFPLTHRVIVDGTVHHLIGWTEDDRVILTPLDPNADYHTAWEARIYLCAQHLRDGVTLRLSSR